MLKRFLVYIYFSLTVSTLFIALCPTARAQYWLEDRKRAEGPGLRVGNLELHPGIGAEMGYDTNVFLKDTGLEDSAILRVSPHLFVSTLGEERATGGETAKGAPPALIFRGGLTGGYYHYVSTSNRDNVSVGLNLHLNINPQRPFSVILDGIYARTVTPFTQYSRGQRTPNYVRDDIGVGPKLVFSSQSGILMGAVGYRFGAGIFEGGSFNSNNSINHTITLDSSWQFFPRTALVYDGSFVFQNYTKDQMPDQVSLNNNRRLNSRIGVNGALTSRVSFTARAGYAAGFYDLYDEYDGVIAQVELRWKPAESFGWKLGYDRSYTSSYVGNYERQNRFYTNADLMVGRVFLLNAEVWAGLLQYGVPLTGDGRALGTSGAEKRYDTRISASIGGEYRFVSWLAANLKVGYTVNLTDFETNMDLFNAAGNTALSPIPAKFRKFEGWFGLRAFY